MQSEVTRDDIDDAMSSCALRLTNVVPPSDDVPAQLIYSADQATHVHFVEEGRLGIVYAAASGPGAPEVLDRLAQELKTVGESERALLDGACTDTAEIARALASCVLCVPTEPETVERLRRALAHDDREVRTAALLALAYAPNAELATAIAAIRDGDESLDLRAHAARYLESQAGLESKGA